MRNSDNPGPWARWASGLNARWMARTTPLGRSVVGFMGLLTGTVAMMRWVHLDSRRKEDLFRQLPIEHQHERMAETRIMDRRYPGYSLACCDAPSVVRKALLPRPTQDEIAKEVARIKEESSAQGPRPR